jgi:hypothetical protein
MSEANKGNKYATGNKNWLGKHHSEESKIKIGKANKGKSRSIETRRTISESLKKCYADKGHHWSNGSLGMHWYNNGLVNKLAFECPEGFIAGRLK